MSTSKWCYLCTMFKKATLLALLFVFTLPPVMAQEALSTKKVEKKARTFSKKLIKTLRKADEEQLLLLFYSKADLEHLKQRSEEITGGTVRVNLDEAFKFYSTSIRSEASLMFRMGEQKGIVWKKIKYEKTLLIDKDRTFASIPEMEISTFYTYNGKSYQLDANQCLLLYNKTWKMAEFLNYKW